VVTRVQDLPGIAERLEQVNLEFAWGDAAPHLRPTAHSLFNIAYLQMASLLTKPDVEIKQNFKRCQTCQRLFWGHGNRLYCGRPCNRQTAYRNKPEGEQKAASA